jgi:hypothetical protein
MLCGCSLVLTFYINCDDNINQLSELKREPNMTHRHLDTVSVIAAKFSHSQGVLRPPARVAYRYWSDFA